MNITQFGEDPNNDFLIEGNHARMSQQKVAEITKVNQSTVSRWLCTNKQTTASTTENQYFLGYELKEFVAYLVFDAKRITDDVRKHNIKLLADASDFGFQMLIDKMAGITEPFSEEKSDEITPDLVANTIDLIFKGVNIKPELIAGVKLNAIAKLNPRLAGIVSDSRQLLIQSSADDRILLTPTELGQKLGVSGQKANKILIEKGLQVKNPRKKGQKDPSYLPTERGEEFCSFTLATGSGDNATTYQQLRWYESVLIVLS